MESQARARSLELNPDLPRRWQGVKYLNPLCCLPRVWFMESWIVAGSGFKLGTLTWDVGTVSVVSSAALNTYLTSLAFKGQLFAWFS